MAQSIFEQGMERPQPIGFSPTSTTEFNYRPVPVLAPVSLCWASCRPSVFWG